MKNYVDIVISRTPAVLYFTGLGRCYTDYGFIGRSIFNLFIISFRLVKNKTYIFVENEQDLELLGRLFSKSRIFNTLSSGISPVFERSNNEKLKKLRRKYDLIFCSRMGRSKNSLYGIRLCNALSERGYSIKIIYSLIENSYKPYINKISSNIEVQDFVELNNLKKIYSDSKILLYTSKREGCPLTILEALARGLITICDQVPGTKDLGIYFPKHVNFLKSDFESDIETIEMLLVDWDKIEPVGIDNLSIFSNEATVNRFISYFKLINAGHK